MKAGLARMAGRQLAGVGRPERAGDCAPVCCRPLRRRCVLAAQHCCLPGLIRKVQTAPAAVLTGGGVSACTMSTSMGILLLTFCETVEICDVCVVRHMPFI